jgi:hypothetical protein
VFAINDFPASLTPSRLSGSGCTQCLRKAALAVACPVMGDQVSLTTIHRCFRGPSFASSSVLHVVNDFAVTPTLRSKSDKPGSHANGHWFSARPRMGVIIGILVLLIGGPIVYFQHWGETKAEKAKRRARDDARTSDKN